jgi:Flp pilus assembly protein TadG
LSAFWNNARGNVALITAIVLPVAVMAVALAIDLQQVEKARSELQDAADSAALVAVSQRTVDTYGQDTASAVTLAKAQFASNASHLASLQDLNSNVTINPSANGVRSTVTFTAKVQTGLSAFLVPTVAISGTSTAENSVAKYVNFYLALDISQSMGIGATQADMNALMSKTPDSCAFGCHLAINSGYPSYWQIARDNNILLRIDSLRDATQQLIDTAVSKEVLPNQFKVGLYTMHKTLTTLVAPSADLNSNANTSVRNLASAIDLGSVTSGGDAQTAFDVTLPQLNDAIPAPGNGMAASAPLAFAFIITDGVADQIYASNGAVVSHPNSLTSGSRRYYYPMDPALCSSLKSRGVTVAVLYTTYLPIPSNSWYNSYVDPFNKQTGTNKVADSLRACASGGFFFTATTDAEIHTQLQNMFLTALQTVRISS